MNTLRVCVSSVVVSAVLASTFASTSSVYGGEPGYGTLKGQFVLEGDIPEPRLVIKKGDSNVKDSAVCAAMDLYSNTLVVDKETKGIKNIFVYVDAAAARKLDVHPELEESDKKKLVFDQKHCRFKPHAMIVRTDQTVVVKSDDPCAHNTHTKTFRNPQENILLPPKDREGVEFTFRRPEFLPMPVTCDIHKWMKAHWLIIDHPYAALTGKQGRFTIEKLPAGEHTFTVWQERSGFLGNKKADYGEIGAEKGITVTIKPGETTDIGTVSVPVDSLPAE